MSNQNPLLPLDSAAHRIKRALDSALNRYDKAPTELDEVYIILTDDVEAICKHTISLLMEDNL